MRRSLALVVLAVALAATSSRPAYADGGSWNVSVGGSLVTAQLLATTGDQVNLVLENKVSLEPFDMPAAGAVLDALGFGGGYSQEVSWSNNGIGPVVKCPNPRVDLFIFCHDESSGGWAVIPDGLPTQIVLSGPAGNANLLVKPSVHSLEYDSALMAVAVALTVVSSNPKRAIVENLRLVAALATKIAPEAAGYVAAASRKDHLAADFEMLSLAKRAAATIADDITQWSIGAIADLSPLALEIKLAIAIGQIDVTLVNLAARLLIGDASSVVTVAHLDKVGPTPTPTLTPTPSPSAARPDFSQFQTWRWTSAGQTPFVFTVPYPADTVSTGLLDGRAMLVGLPGSGLYKDGWDPALPLPFAGEIYDPATNQWTKTAPTPPLDDVYALSPTQEGALLQAESGSRETVAFSYDAATDRWSQTAVPTDWPAASRGEYTDPTTGTKQQVPSLSADWYIEAIKVLADGRVGALLFPVGGGWLLGVAEFDPQSRSWGPVHTFQAPPCSASLVLSSGYTIVIGGGYSPVEGNDCVQVQATTVVSVVDPATGEVVTAGSLATARTLPYILELADGRVLVVAGLRGAVNTDEILKTAELFGPPAYAP